MAELSARTGVPVATLKYYLREGVLPPGTPQAATRADYSEAHVDRVRLIRAMIETAGLSIAAARQVAGALDHPPSTRSELLAVAARAIPTPAADHPVSPIVQDLVDALGWDLPPDLGPLHSLSAAVDAVQTAGLPLELPTLLAYAKGSLEIARVDVGAVQTGDPARALTLVVAGTVLGEPVLAALRRIAQAHVARSLPRPEGVGEGDGEGIPDPQQP